MKAKRTLLPVDWTDVVMEEVPIVSANALEVLTAQRFARFMRKSPSRVTRSATNGPRRMVQILSNVL